MCPNKSLPFDGKEKQSAKVGKTRENKKNKQNKRKKIMIIRVYFDILTNAVFLQMIVQDTIQPIKKIDVANKALYNASIREKQI